MRVTDSEVISRFSFGCLCNIAIFKFLQVKACFLRRCRTIPAILSRIHGFPSVPFAVAQNDVAIAKRSCNCQNEVEVFLSAEAPHRKQLSINIRKAFGCLCRFTLSCPYPLITSHFPGSHRLGCHFKSKSNSLVRKIRRRISKKIKSVTPTTSFVRQSPPTKMRVLNSRKVALEAGQL